MSIAHHRSRYLTYLLAIVLVLSVMGCILLPVGKPGIECDGVASNWGMYPHIWQDLQWLTDSRLVISSYDGYLHVLDKGATGQWQRSDAMELPRVSTFRFAPSNQLLAISSYEPIGRDHPAVSIIDVDTNATVMHLGDGNNLVWSSNGQQLAFRVLYETAIGYDTRVMLVDFSDGPTAPTQLLAVREYELYIHGWSPDGTWLMLTRLDRRRDLSPRTALVDRDGNMRWLSSTPIDCESLPTWSPDGERIALAARAEVYGDYELYIADREGHVAQITHNSLVDDVRPVWSPDGKQIAFVASSVEEERGTHSRDAVVIYNVEDQTFTTLVEIILNREPLVWHTVREIAWSPSGERIAYSLDNTQTAEWYIVDVATGTQHHLVTLGWQEQDAAATYTPPAADALDR